MKQLLAIAAVAAVAAVAQPAEAQQIAGGWNTIYASYDMPKIKAMESGYDDDDFNGGFTVGYSITQQIVPKAALYIEYGVSFSQASYKENIYDDEYIGTYSISSGSTGTVMQFTDIYMDYEAKMKYNYLSVPINLSYCISTNGNLSIIPFAGLNLKCGLTAKATTEWILSGDSADDLNKYSSQSEFWDTFEDYGYERSAKLNFYKEDDLGSDKWNRLLVGYQVGVNFSISRLLLGIKYQGDISEICSDYKYNTTSFTAGLRF